MSVLYNFSSLILKISKTRRFCPWSYPQILEMVKVENGLAYLMPKQKKIYGNGSMKKKGLLLNCLVAGCAQNKNDPTFDVVGKHS
jgi:hypothetical protein